MRRTKTKKGITLVALIITIVILLILAVVTINTVSDDGIINKTKLAVNSYKESEFNESQKLQGFVTNIEQHLGQGGSSSGDDYYAEQMAQDELVGTWLFNETISLPQEDTLFYPTQNNTNNPYLITYGNYGEVYTIKYWTTYIDMTNGGVGLNFDANAVYNNGWMDEEARTLTITWKIQGQKPETETELLNFLKANATKID